MANMPKYNDAEWNKVKQYQISLLEGLKEVSELVSEYIDELAPYNIYEGKRNYQIRGYERIVFKLTCPAVVGFSNAKYGPKPPGAGPGNGKPTKIHERDVYVDIEHQMEIYLPRSYDTEPIGWGIRFIKQPPMYPNIMCAHTDDNNLLRLNFDGEIHAGLSSGGDTGMVCIGAASARTRPVSPAALVNNLIRYLKILDDNLFADIGNSGTNDKGFDIHLWEHYVMNLQTIKNALANAEVKPRPKKKKLGKTVQERAKKKLGKKANER